MRYAENVYQCQLKMNTSKVSVESMSLKLDGIYVFNKKTLTSSYADFIINMYLSYDTT